MEETVKPAVLKSNPQLEAIMPLPTPEITPAKDCQNGET
jgi:hypothetical protein